MTEDEFDEFYASSFARVTGQVYAMIGNRDEAQECVQEAFVRPCLGPPPAPRAQRVTRVGRAVLATYDGGEWSPDTIATGAADATERTGRITPAMCVFNAAGC